MCEVDYFTDASLGQNNNTNIGAYGYLYLNKQHAVVDKYVSYFIVNDDINYLECRAIHDCLLRIRQIGRPGIKYTIFTDSSTCYDFLEKSFQSSFKIKDSKFYQQLIDTNRLINDIIRNYIDIHIIDTKGHCKDPKMLLKYLNKKTPGFDLEYARLITEGNRLVDGMVSHITKYWKLYTNQPYIKLN